MLTEAQAQATFRRFFGQRDWNQACQAAVAWLAKYSSGKVQFYDTARDAFEASQIVSTNPAKAKLNDVHFWAIGPDWHTGAQVNNGVFMASVHTDQSWGTNLGLTTVEAYGRATGAVYRGFARGNGVNRIAISPPRKGGSARIRRNAAYLNGLGYGMKSTAATDGLVDQTGHVSQVYWKLVQTWGRKHGHYGAEYRIDGKVGTQTRKVEKLIDKLAAKK